MRWQSKCTGKRSKGNRGESCHFKIKQYNLEKNNQPHNNLKQLLWNPFKSVSFCTNYRKQRGEGDIYEGVKKQQEHAKLVFSGHNLSRKGKNSKQKQYKNKNKKNQSITFCCGDCRKKHGGGHSGAKGKGPEGFEGSLLGHYREEPQKKKKKKTKKGWLGPKLQPAVKKKRGSGVFCSWELRKTKRTHAVSSSPTNYISKMCSGASKVLVTSFISLFTSKLSLKLSTQRNKA